MTDPTPTRTREQELADTFVALADTLVEDYDVVELLDRLVASCVELLGVAAAGLLLGDQNGHLAVAASSSEEARLIEIFQLQNDEGPCLECFRSGTAVSGASLAAQTERWPLFAPAAVNAGFSSVTAVPMRLRRQTIGALNLFSESEGVVGDDDQRLAQALADVATIGILQQRSVHQSNLLADQLQHALNSRVVIEQAKGVLAERSAVDIETAFDGLRRHARAGHRKITDVAFDIVHNGLELDL
jgi:transcriptional regulator with GAF, ATPase, and Fis domain